MPNEDFPLRVDGVTAGWAAERRPEDVIPAARTDAWQLVYVRSGTIEERCDDRRVLLRAGGLLFHQPAETFGMRPVGEVPPDVLRLDFLCTQAGMDRFRGAVFHAEPQEQHDLNWLMDAVTEYFEPPDTLGQATVPKEEQPYGAQQQLTIHLENLLILLARGDTPGEVAERMGYRSGAYFSQKFKEATGNTPSAYRRLQQGLPARRLNRQQKDKDESKTSIAETPPKK